MILEEVKSIHEAKQSKKSISSNCSIALEQVLVFGGIRFEEPSTKT
jgi:hypothetical protein